MVNCCADVQSQRSRRHITAVFRISIFGWDNQSTHRCLLLSAKVFEVLDGDFHVDIFFPKALDVPFWTCIRLAQIRAVRPHGQIEIEWRSDSTWHGFSFPCVSSAAHSSLRQRRYPRIHVQMFSPDEVPWNCPSHTNYYEYRSNNSYALSKGNQKCHSRFHDFILSDADLLRLRPGKKC